MEGDPDLGGEGLGVEGGPRRKATGKGGEGGAWHIPGNMGICSCNILALMQKKSQNPKDTNKTIAHNSKQGRLPSNPKP